MNCGSEWIYYGAGMVYKKNRHFKEAEEKFRYLLAIYPSYGNAYVQLGFIRKNEGKKFEAKALFEKGLSYNPENENAHHQIGLLQMQSKNYNDAANNFSRVLELNPNRTDAMVHLGITMGGKGDFCAAENLITQSYSKDQEQKNGYARLGWIKAERQDWPSAVEIMSRDLKAGRISSAWQIKLAIGQAFTGDYDNAVKLIEDLYNNDKDAVDGFARLGWASYLSSGDEQKLHFLVAKDIHLKRLSVDGNKIMAMAMFLRGELILAGKLIDSLYAKYPYAKDGFATMGWLHIEKVDLEQGIALMGKDYRMQRLSTVWKINYAYQLLKTGESQTAGSILNEIMKLEPHQQEFRIGYQLKPLKIISKRDIEQMAIKSGLAGQKHRPTDKLTSSQCNCGL